jgi:hypothetical protein
VSKMSFAWQKQRRGAGSEEKNKVKIMRVNLP